MDVFIISVVGYLNELAATNPKLVSVLAIAYIIGLVLKIVRESVQKFVLESPSKDDDLKLAEVEAKPVVKALYLLADLLIRFKK